MLSRFSTVFRFSCFVALLVVHNGFGQNSRQEQEIEVSLRMIGHQVLLKAGDSTSRVLPILKEEDRYRIQFESEFAYETDQLVSIIDAVVKEIGLAQSYIVEVEQCDTEEVVYSFKIDGSVQMDIVPCKGRVQPISCYNLLFTILESEALSEANLVKNIDSSSGSKLGNRKWLYFIIGSLFSLMAIFFLLWRRKKNTTTNPNLITLGEYQFDKHNTELIIEHQKIELTSKEADLLLLLYDAANTTVERERILNKVWGDEGDYVGRTLDVFISKLRKKLEFDSKVKIQNIRGVGYKLVVDS